MANDQGIAGPTPGTPMDRRAQRHESHASATYQSFLNELCATGNMDRELAECAAVSVLCTLERRIYGEEARDLESQLPFKLRELLQTCEKPLGPPSEKFGRDQFLRMIANDLQKSPEEVEPIVRAVFTTVRAQITEGEAEDVANQLPRDLAELWRMNQSLVLGP